MRAPGSKVRRLGFSLGLLVALACAGDGVYRINLMPAPDLYHTGFDPLPDEPPLRHVPYGGVLYATDRLPAPEDDSGHYLNERGQVLRLGQAHVTTAERWIDWETARKVSLLKNRTDAYPLEVAEVIEYGVLDRSITPFVPQLLDDDPRAAALRFSEAVNAQLARSKRKHIYIFVHGYKVVFEDPLLVSTELWHFLGYDGVFIAYAWPSTPSAWAYIKDIDTAAGFARNFRIFLEYLAEETDAERIHVLGYSAGTRLVTRAFEQLAIRYGNDSDERIREELRIGNLLLVGSDVDRGVFGNYLADGAIRVPEHMTIYISEEDQALGISRFLSTRDRLGQMWSREMLPSVAQYIRDNGNRLSVIDVTYAEGALSGNGHGYFRKSPWVSSDVLLTLMHDLPPAERGLALAADRPIWTFPEDYNERLWAALVGLYPDLASQ